jgi:Zn-dependent M28 family amino/carboxypeptidase
MPPGTRFWIGAGGLALVAAGAWWAMIRMPGASHRGPLSPLTGEERALVAPLRRDVEMLAGRIGERNLEHPEALAAAARFLRESVEAAGYPVTRDTYAVGGRPSENVAAERPGRDRPGEIVIVGAHYDSVIGSPGANDNATGAAAMLALARAFASRAPSRTVRFVGFANEEPPRFQTEAMGSWVYARRRRAAGEEIVAMLSLETLGYYADAPGSQRYPPPVGLFYPSTGNFVGFVGNVASRHLVREAIAAFRAAARFPSEGGALPGVLPGIGWSDHWAFWQEGYPAIMVTDTAPFRYPYYHTREDTPDKVDFERLARVVAGLTRVVAHLAGDAGPR